MHILCNNQFLKRFTYHWIKFQVLWPWNQLNCMKFTQFASDSFTIWGLQSIELTSIEKANLDMEIRSEYLLDNLVVDEPLARLQPTDSLLSISASLCASSVYVLIWLWKHQHTFWNTRYLVEGTPLHSVGGNSKCVGVDKSSYTRTNLAPVSPIYYSYGYDGNLKTSHTSFRNISEIFYTSTKCNVRHLFFQLFILEIITQI